MAIPAALRLDRKQIEEWRARIRRSLDSREDKERRWLAVLEMYLGRYNESFQDTNRVTGMWHHVAVRQTASNIYFQDPRMNFVGHTVKGMQVARIMERVAAYERKLIGAEKQERDCLDNGLIFGTGVLKFAWNAQFGIDAPFADNRAMKAAGEMLGMGENSVVDGELSLDHGALTEHNTSILSGHPWIKSIPPWDFFVDPEALTYEEARWVAHRFRRPWVDVVRDKRWDAEARKEVEPSGNSQWFDSNVLEGDWLDNPDAVDSSLVTCFEIYDKKTQTIIVLAEGSEKPLDVRPYPYFGKDGPYEVFQLLPDPESFWGIPFADTFTPQVQAMNLLRTQMMDHIQRAAWQKGLYRRGEIKEEDMEKLVNARSDEYVGVDTNEPIQNYIEIFPYLPIAADVWKLTELFRNDFQEISGVSENALGSGRGVQTATEANIVAQQSGLRSGDMRFKVDQMLRGSTRKIMALLRQFWTGQQVIPIVGENGQLWDVVVRDTNTVINPQTQEPVHGEYDVDIEPGSTERVDRNVRLRQGIELFREALNAQPFLQQQGKMLDLGELFKNILRDSDLVKNPDRILINVQQPPVAPGADPRLSQSPAPASVTNLGQIQQARPSFESGRQASETARFN